MIDDPIIEEVTRTREQIAAKFNYDVRAIGEDAKRREMASTQNVEDAVNTKRLNGKDKQ